MKISTVQEIKEHFHKINGKILYLFDIDNTIITTYTNFGLNIDKLKLVKQQQSHNKQHIDHLLSHWRMTREVFLTDDQWPEFLQTIEQPYALTKMDVGRLGKIMSMEQWRNNELCNLEIKFSSIYPIDSKIYSEPKAIGVDNATFFNGIFYTGDAKKADVVKKILSHNRYDLVIFIDDRVEQLEDVKHGCLEAGVQYLPMQFILKTRDYPKQSLAEVEAEAEIMKFLNLNPLYAI